MGALEVSLLAVWVVTYMSAPPAVTVKLLRRRTLASTVLRHR